MNMRNLLLIAIALIGMTAAAQESEENIFATPIEIEEPRTRPTINIGIGETIINSDNINNDGVDGVTTINITGAILEFGEAKNIDLLVGFNAYIGESSYFDLDFGYEFGLEWDFGLTLESGFQVLTAQAWEDAELVPYIEIGGRIFNDTPLYLETKISFDGNPFYREFQRDLHPLLGGGKASTDVLTVALKYKF